MDDIIIVENLNKSFGDNKAVDNLSFNVKRGEFFSFLGQNGAGKSTTINMLIGTLAPDSGFIKYGNGKSYKEFKNKIGIVYQNNILDNLLTVEENLKFFGSLYIKDKKLMKDRYQELAKLFDFKSFEKKKFKTLSGGQKRKVEVARALFNTPEILILDEPTTGLDPKTRIDVWNIIEKIRKNTGMTVFLTTHYMEETADADEVMIIHNGKKIAQGSPATLKERYSCDKVTIVPKNQVSFEKSIENMEYKKNADFYLFLFDDSKKEIEFLNKFKNQIKYFEVHRGSMDDVFLNAVGEKITGEEK